MEVFAGLVGQAQIKRELEASLRHDSLPQALIFVGPAGVGRLTAARSLVRHLHGGASKMAADTFWFADRLEDKRARGVAGPIKATADEMVLFLQLSALSSRYKIAVVQNAELLSDEAQNALLKTLEEPKPNRLVVFIVENEQQLLPTIVSRSKVIRFAPLSPKEISQALGANASREVVEKAQGSLGRALRLLSEEGQQMARIHDFWSQADTLSLADRLAWSEEMKDRERAVEFLTEGIRYMRGEMVSVPKVATASKIDELTVALQKLQDSANVRLTLDSVMVVL